MFINKVLNFQGGWNYLLEYKSKQLEEISDSIRKLDRISLTDPQFDRYFATIGNRHAITPNTIPRIWRFLVEKEGWVGRRVSNENDPRSRFYLRNFKDGVSIRMLASSRSAIPNWIFVETQKAYEKGACDISVLLVPMENLKEIYTHIPVERLCFEDVDFQLKELSPIRANAPFVIIGFSEFNSELEIIDVLSEEINGQINTIEKCLEFSPEQYQAGMGILSYFGEIIRTKHPDIHAKVRIEQDGSFVRLHIETEDGTKEIIEKTLEEYTLVVAQKEPIEILFSNKIHMMALQNKLEMAYMEVRQTKEILELTRESSNTRLYSLEEEVKYLRSHIGSQMSLANQSSQIIKAQVSASSKVALELINSSNLLVKDLLADKLMDKKVLEALEVIDKRLRIGVSQDDETAIKDAFRVIAEESPDIIDELGTALKNTAYGVSGNIVFQWLSSTLNMLP